MNIKSVSGVINKISEEFEMSCNRNNANNSIKCTVQQCKYHCNTKDYCSLDCIIVGTHEQNPTNNECTDCKSFELA